MRKAFKHPLVMAAMLACLCAVLRITAPLDHIYWNSRFHFGRVAAPQAIVLVTLDSGQAVPDTKLANLLEILNRQAPSHIYYDQPILAPDGSVLPEKVRALGTSITLVERIGNWDGRSANFGTLPQPSHMRSTRRVYSGWLIDFLNYAQAAPYVLGQGEQAVPSLALALAGKPKVVSGLFIPDFRVDPNTVLTVPARQLLDGKIAPGLLTGRAVIVTSAERTDDAQIGYFGHGRVNPIILDIAGSASIAAGKAINLGRFALLVLVIAGLALASRVRHQSTRGLAYGGVALFSVIGPGLLQTLGFIGVPAPGILAVAVYGSIRLWTRLRQRVQRISLSGLPNFFAMADQLVPAGHHVIVASIARYEEFLATLPPELHSECARQIALRFAVGSAGEAIYHSGSGHFAWIEPGLPAALQADHFAGMRALFTAPLLVGAHVFDGNVHFGIDHNSDFDTQTRINTALACANEAMSAGRTVAQFEAGRLANTPWELSLLARIDEGMKNGDIWVAYQPQWDYRQARISGAEALVRWSDPERGLIRPDLFIVQAERAGRIDALTYWVIDQAISAALAMNRVVSDFAMSINLSALLLDHPGLISAVAEIVHRRDIDCRLFTFEVTETATLRSRPAAVVNLQRLRAMGFRLSIDDFGTGEASLLYLAELPSDELKIDRYFIARMATCERERAIVRATIELAHALKQTVTAEGIEDQATFDLLNQMGCDKGQGYYIARPGTFEQLSSFTGSARRFAADI